MGENKEKKVGETSAELQDFKCSICNLHEKVHYKGTSPPFSRGTVLKYSSYVMKDPFSPPGKGEILVLGGDCCVCGNPVCINKDCSLFYSKMFCINCALQNITSFPLEIQQKLNKV